MRLSGCSNGADLDERIDDVDKRVRSLRSEGLLSSAVLLKIRDFFRIKQIHNSNAIEGNKLSIGETRLVVENGLTISGKPLKDVAEAKNLSDALDFLEKLATKTHGEWQTILQSDIKSMHGLILRGIDSENAGRYRDRNVQITGSGYRPPSAPHVQENVDKFFAWFSGVSEASQGLSVGEGLLAAAAAHTWFVTIHPFIDGNGRVSRLVMNLLLMRFQIPIVVITLDDKQRYYDALEESQSTDLTPFLELVLDSVDETMAQYERAVQEHRETREWPQSILSKLSEPDKLAAQNDFALWAPAMRLVKAYFRDVAGALSRPTRPIYFNDFGELEFEKYFSLRQVEGAKKTWSFRVDFALGGAQRPTVRYLFFYGSATARMAPRCHVTLFAAREERPFFFTRLDQIVSENVPGLFEIGFVRGEDNFLIRSDRGINPESLDDVGRLFINDVVTKHFRSE